ncbi:MAG: orotate phosphoribosyltransferase [candidate division WOR-3 bacterium]|nr:orotate phosphoribosyltransferase [candidate division WOR-3 bacterium]
MDYKFLLEEAGALLKGHFLLTSGLHSDKYIEKMRILENPRLLKPFIDRMREIGPDADWIVGPTLGGSIIAFELARVMGKKCAYAERMGEARKLKRGFDIKDEDTILIVDDVLTTGGSIKQTIKAIQKGRILGGFVMIDRSNQDPEIDIPIHSVLKYPIRNYTPEDCPLCRKKIPLTRRGG